MPNYLLECFAFIFGLCIGSFLNVCIYRLPISKSIAYPGSACPSCATPIAARDNIPLLGYLLLGGRCRHCRVHIPLRYPLVELITGLLALGTVLKFGIGVQAPVYFVFIAALLTITFIDIDHRIIPDVISLPGIPLGFAAAFILPDFGYADSLAGILLGGGSLYLVAWGYALVTRKEGMGGGDIKLLAMIGAFIGWKGVLFTIFAASAAGTAAGLFLIAVRGGTMKLAVPFGPFLSLGAMTYLFFGQTILFWYFSIL